MESSITRNYIEPVLVINSRASSDDFLQLSDLIESDKNVLVLGPPGSGKSSLLRHLNSLLEMGSSRHFSFINLPSLRSRAEIYEMFQEKIQDCPSSENIIFLLDGLDELLIPDNYVSVIQEISKNISNVRFFITSRLSPQTEWQDDKWLVVSIKPFDRRQICEALERRFGHQANEMLEELNKSSYLLESLKTPLLLEMFMQILANYTFSPRDINPVSLISMFVDEELSNLKRQIGSSFSSADASSLRRIFIKSAEFMSNHSVHTVARDEFILFIEEWISNTGYKDINLVLDLLVGSQILTFDRDREYLAFSHKVFFDYFLASNVFSVTGKVKPSISLPQESLKIRLRFQQWESIGSIKNYLTNRIKLIDAYGTGSEIIYATRGSVEVGLAVVISSAIIYCFMKFADAFFSHLGELAAKSIADRKHQLKIPPHIERELPEWILQNEDLKLEYFKELTRLLSAKANLIEETMTEPKDLYKELIEIAVLTTLSKTSRGDIDVGLYDDSQ